MAEQVVRDVHSRSVEYPKGVDWYSVAVHTNAGLHTRSEVLVGAESWKLVEVQLVSAVHTLSEMSVAAALS